VHHFAWGCRFWMRKRFLRSVPSLFSKLCATSANCWVINLIKRDRNCN
jgi:hypothetical protein